MSCGLCVACCILGVSLAMCLSSGAIWRGLGGYLDAFGSHLGLSWAVLGQSWGYLGKTWGLLWLTLGLDHQAWKTHTCLKASLGHTVAIFAYKINGIFMVLNMQCSVDIKNAYLAEMSKSLSPYACAAKTFFSAKTSAKILIPVNQKCV